MHMHVCACVYVYVCSVSATSYRYGIIYVYAYMWMHACVLYIAEYEPLEMYDPLCLMNAAGESLTMTKSWLQLAILHTDMAL